MGPTQPECNLPPCRARSSFARGDQSVCQDIPLVSDHINVATPGSHSLRMLCSRQLSAQVGAGPRAWSGLLSGLLACFPGLPGPRGRGGHAGQPPPLEVRAPGAGRAPSQEGAMASCGRRGAACLAVPASRVWGAFLGGAGTCWRHSSSRVLQCSSSLLGL